MTTTLQVAPLAGSSDGELARRAGRGDNDAFQALYARHAPGLVAFVRARVPGEAGDILLDVWTRISDGLATFDGENFRAWAFGITRSVMADNRQHVAVASGPSIISFGLGAGTSR